MATVECYMLTVPYGVWCITPVIHLYTCLSTDYSKKLVKSNWCCWNGDWWWHDDVLLLNTHVCTCIMVRNHSILYCMWYSATKWDKNLSNDLFDRPFSRLTMDVWLRLEIELSRNRFYWHQNCDKLFIPDVSYVVQHKSTSIPRQCVIL